MPNLMTEGCCGDCPGKTRRSQRNRSFRERPANGLTENRREKGVIRLIAGTEITKKIKSTVKKTRRNTAGKFFI